MPWPYINVPHIFNDRESGTELEKASYVYHNRIENIDPIPRLVHWKLLVREATSPRYRLIVREGPACLQINNPTPLLEGERL